VDNDGNALVAGALYFNDSANEMRVYDGANWIAATSAGNVSLILYEYTATSGQTTFSGSDDNSATLSYTVDNLQVVMNGVVLDPADFTATNGTSVVLDSGATLGDQINIYAFKSFTTADMVSKTAGGTFSGAVGFDGDLTIADKIVHSGDTNTAIRFADADTVTIETGGSERLRVTDAGNVGIGATPNSYTNFTTLTLGGSGSSDIDFEKNGTIIASLFSRQADSQFTIATSDGGDFSVTTASTERLNIQSSDGMLTALPVYNLTTSGSANVNVQSSGALLRSTSSEKYKQNIEDMGLSYAQAILNLRPVYYKSKCKLDNADNSHWGFIAEEVEKIDPRLVHYKTTDVTFKEVVDDRGITIKEKIETTLETPQPEGVQYDRLTPAIVKLLQEQQKTIEVLETKVAALEAK